MLISIALIVILAVAVILIFAKQFKNKTNALAYEKRPYLFDTVSEFDLFNILVELFGDDYFIFPQIHYSHLVRPKRSTWSDERGLRSRIDRKSADFVFCDREKVIPVLVIELDGKVHAYEKKQKRDDFINELMRSTGLSIIHLNPDQLDKEAIKNKIEAALNQH